MRLYSERLDGTEIPQGLSVTRTTLKNYWRLRIGPLIVRLFKPYHRGRVTWVRQPRAFDL
jgi:hypothetical protein